jgi:hypothetical protein
LDYTLFIVYLLASVGVGALFVKEQKTTKDYFLAGRSMGSVVVAISVIAALFSGITYLGAPSEVYAHDISFALVSLAFFIATPITTLVFLPLYYQSRFYTAYQYLEERFSIGVRTLASAPPVARRPQSHSRVNIARAMLSGDDHLTCPSANSRLSPSLWVRYQTGLLTTVETGGVGAAVETGGTS